ncbi:MAG: lysylphosphatidylglycerol synthase domain-containing protein [Patescibacteria group bacterium]
MKKILINIISGALILVIFYFLGREFAANWSQIRSFPFHFNIGILASASLVYALMYLIFAFGWYVILKYLRCNVPLYETILYFFITQPAKYVPGKIWIGVTRMKFCKPHGVSHSITLLSTGTEAVMEIFAATYISLVAILKTNMFGQYSIWWIIAISILGLLILWPRIFYCLINIYLKIVRQEPIVKDHHVSFWKLLSLQLLYIAGVLCLGVSSALFLQSFAPVNTSHFPFLISIGAFGYLASMLAIFTPSGLGVREGVWFFALRTIVAPHVSLVYAFVSRIWTIVMEAILLFIALLLLWTKRRKQKVSI